MIGLDRSSTLLAMTDGLAQASAGGVTVLQGSAEAIPLESARIDTVVTTWTLCSIPNVSDALMELRRVLKHDGELLFLEHGATPDQDVRQWQDRLTPLWNPVTGGCHLTP